MLPNAPKEGMLNLSPFAQHRVRSLVCQAAVLEPLFCAIGKHGQAHTSQPRSGQMDRSISKGGGQNIFLQSIFCGRFGWVFGRMSPVSVGAFFPD